MTAKVGLHFRKRIVGVQASVQVCVTVRGEEERSELCCPDWRVIRTPFLQILYCSVHDVSVRAVQDHAVFVLKVVTGTTAKFTEANDEFPSVTMPSKCKQQNASVSCVLLV